MSREKTRNSLMISCCIAAVLALSACKKESTDTTGTETTPAPAAVESTPAMPSASSLTSEPSPDASAAMSSDSMMSSSSASSM